MKTIKTLAVCGIVCALPFVIQAAQSFKRKSKIVIPVQPAQDYLKKFNNVASAPVCPRSSEVPEQTASESASEHEHCPHCRLGIFFRRTNDTVSCSYCEVEKQG